MPLIALIFAVAALLWLTLLLRHGGLLAGCVLVVITGSCFGHPFFHRSVLTIDRTLWAVVVGLYCVQRFRREGVSRCAWTRFDLWFVAFLAILSVSTLSHDFQYDDSQPLSRLLFLYLMPAGLYWIVRHETVTPRAATSIAAAFAGFGIYLSLTAVAEVAGLRSLVFPRYIVSADYVEFLGRGRGPFLNPSANGIYLGTGLASCAFFWPLVARRWRYGLLGAVGLVLLGGAATLTRCVWLGLLLSGMLLMWTTLPVRRSLGVSLLAGSLGVIILVGSWQHLVAFKRDQNVSVADMKESAKLRPMLAAVAWQVIQDHPLTGVGYGQYKQVDKRYIALRHVNLPLDKIRPYHQHNVLLALLTETGVLGTVPFVVLLTGWATAAWKLSRRGDLPWAWRNSGMVYLICLINYLANGMFQDVALIPMVNSILFLQAAVVMSVAEQASCVTTVNSPLQRIAVWLRYLPRFHWRAAT